MHKASQSWSDRGITKWSLLMAILVAFALNPVLIAALVVVSN